MLETSAAGVSDCRSIVRDKRVESVGERKLGKSSRPDGACGNKLKDPSNPTKAWISEHHDM
jgi:hypothetical protein